jgi:hypothetical protein
MILMIQTQSTLHPYGMPMILPSFFILSSFLCQTFPLWCGEIISVRGSRQTQVGSCITSFRTNAYYEAIDIKNLSCAKLSLFPVSCHQVLFSAQGFLSALREAAHY